MSTTLRFPLKKYLKSTSLDPKHWSTFISPSMAATLDISHGDRDGEMASLTVTITHESGGVDVMENMELHSHEAALLAPKVIFKENMVMLKHADGRFQMTFTTHGSAIEFVDRVRRLGSDCIAANESIPLLKEGGLKRGTSTRKCETLHGVNSHGSLNMLASQSSALFMPPPPTQLSQSIKYGYSPPSPSQKRTRYDFEDTLSQSQYREIDSADNVNINVEDDKLLTESILRVVREPDFVRLVEKLRTIDALRFEDSFSSKHN